MTSVGAAMGQAITIPAIASMLPTVHTGVMAILDGHSRSEVATRAAVVLTSSALRHSEGEVTIGISEIEGGIRIEVADQRGTCPRSDPPPSMQPDPLAEVSDIAARVGSRRARSGDVTTWAVVTTIPTSDLPSGQTPKEGLCES